MIQKDSSQETIISLLGMLVSVCLNHYAYIGLILLKAGSFVVSLVTSPLATWSCLIILLSIHLKMNHAAVRSVNMRTFSRQRANIVFSEYFTNGKVLTPEEVSAQERIFEWDGVLRWRRSGPIRKARLGASLLDLIRPLALETTSTGAIRDNALLSQIVDFSQDDRYLLWYDVASATAYVTLKGDCTPQDQVKAWVHSLLLAHRMEERHVATSAAAEVVLGLLVETRTEMHCIWKNAVTEMKGCGWNFDIASVETSSGVRIYFRPE